MYKADIGTWNCKITKNEIKILHLYYPHSVIKIQLTLYTLHTVLVESGN